MFYNSGEEADAGSAQLALPTLPPPFNLAVLSETEIPVGRLLKHLFSLFVFFPPPLKVGTVPQRLSRERGLLQIKNEEFLCSD